MYAGELVEVGAGARHLRRAAAPVHPAADRQPAVARAARARFAASRACRRRCSIRRRGCSFHPRCPHVIDRCSIDVTRCCAQLRPEPLGRLPPVLTRRQSMEARHDRPARSPRTSRKVFGGGCSTRLNVALDDFSLRHRRRRRRRSPPSSARAAAARPPWRGCCSGFIAPTLRRGALPRQESAQAVRGRAAAPSAARSRRSFRTRSRSTTRSTRVDHVLTTPIAKFRLAKSRPRRASNDRGGAARGRPAAGGDARAATRTS